MPNRRDCLKAAAVTAAASLMGRPFAQARQAASARSLTKGAAQVFVDLADVEATENVRQLFHTADKHPENPVLVGEKEWERVMGGPCGSFIRVYLLSRLQRNARPLRR